MQFVTTDNNCGVIIENPQIIEDLQGLANVRIDRLRDQSGNDLWLFPKKGDRYDDKIDDQYLFELDGNILTTNNIMGFVGCGNTELTIRSRFSCYRRCSQSTSLISTTRRVLMKVWILRR